tara:strand:+ start:12742 stop:14478 length:1737 start_codon:yes stop_codon:yes gene_type:complete
MAKVVDKKLFYQMSDEEKMEYEAKVQAEIEASGGKLRRGRRRNKNAKSYEQIKAEIDAKEAAKQAKKKPKFMPSNEAFNTINFGIQAIADTVKGLKKAFQSRAEREEKIEKEKKLDAARLLSRKKSEDAEKQLEQSTKKTKGTGAVGKAFKKTGVRLLTAIVAIIAGFVINNLPKIMKFLEKVMVVLKKFFKYAYPLFDVIFKIVGNLFDGMADLALDTSADSMQKDLKKNKTDLEKIEDDLKATKKGMDKNLENVEKNIDQTKEDLKSRTSKGQTAEEIVEEKSGEKVKMERKGEEDSKKSEELSTEESGEVLKEEPKKVEEKAEKKEVEKSEPPKVVMSKPPATIEEAALTVKVNAEEEGVNPAVGDGVKKKKVVTPSGLGMDMYKRKIVLNPDAADGWKKVLEAAAKDGIDLTKSVTSSYRSPEKQEELIGKEDGKSVISPAPVSKSPHVQGWAIDIATGTDAHKWMLENSAKFGWSWQGENDPVHFDFMGGAQSDTNWLQPGKMNWLKSNVASLKNMAMLTYKKMTTIPVPINNLTEVVKVPSGNPEFSGIDEKPVVASNNVIKHMQTINNSFT